MMLKTAWISALAVMFSFSSGAQTPATAAAPKTGAATLSPAGKPVELADTTAQGKLKNPYSASDKPIVASGNKLYNGVGCEGCHGGTGGGGICPPLADGVWVYGGDDDTLFRLVAYGSQTLQSKGYSRKAQENVVAPMPAMGNVIGTGDDLWRIITFIRAQYHGPAECRFGCPPPDDAR